METIVNEHVTKSVGGLLSCATCGYQSRNTGHMRQHVESKHVSVQYFCNFCDAACPTKNALQKHMSMKHSHKWFTCRSSRNKYFILQIWNYWINIVSALNEEIRKYLIKLDNQVWGCASCEFQSKYQNAVSNHIEAKHFYSDGYSCQFCSKNCPNRQALRMHVSRYHKNW